VEIDARKACDPLREQVDIADHQVTVDTAQLTFFLAIAAKVCAPNPASPACVGALAAALFQEARLKLAVDRLNAAQDALLRCINNVLAGQSVGGQPTDLFLACSVGSADPNDKFGTTGSGDARYVSGDSPLPYDIHFENKAEATAPAQEVVVTDQLDVDKFDLNTFNLGLMSFGDTQVEPPPGVQQFATDVDLRPANNLIVRINAGLDEDTGIVTWRFISLDPSTGLPTTDALAGFLPPNKNPPEGEGNVLYTAMPKENLPTGTEIRNRAVIVFDTNPPIETPEWVNTLDTIAPTSQVLPLSPTQSETSFTVNWTGTDVGSGILDYTIFFSEDGGPYTPWFIDTVMTTGVFNGQTGKSYAFYSVARDQTGNLEDPPAVADTTTRIGVANRPPLANAGPDQMVECSSPSGANVMLDGSASSDPDNDPLTYSWTGPFSTTSGPKPTVSLPLGTNTSILTVNDDKGGTASDGVIVKMMDTTPPSIGSVTANPNALWPPNHKMVPVTVAVSASDTCSAAPVCKITAVSSNEPVNGTGDGDTAPDWQITGNLTVNLRAERAGTGNGRVYTVTVGCTDASGNSSAKTTVVTVPHDQGK